MTKRIEQLSSWLKEKDVSFSFVNSTANVFYLTNFYCKPHERLLGLFVFPNGGPLLVCPSMEVSLARAAGYDGDIIGYSDTDNPWSLIAKALKERNIIGQSVALEKEQLNVERFEELQTLVAGGRFVSIEEKLHQMRMVKDENEIKILRQAAELADFGVEVGINAITTGKTEMEVLAEIEFELKKKGIREMSFSTLVLTGEKSAAPHGKPGLTEMKKGDLVLFDLGVVLDGYCSDITRTVGFGSLNDQQTEIYNTVLKAELTALENCLPGVEIGKIDQAARNVISEAGYGDYFIHRIGHGLGIDVHEFPSMNATNKATLKEGMTFTVEPGIYLPGVGGVRIEDDVLITKDGFETLTKFPKELMIID